MYWYPLYAFARGMGVGAEEAKDLNQAFFEHLLASGLVNRVSPEGGKLRSYLLASLKHFILQEWRRASTKKRGGGIQFFSIDESDVEGRLASDQRDEEGPERAFDRGRTRPGRDDDRV